jgi:hypothetical protein
MAPKAGYFTAFMKAGQKVCGKPTPLSMNRTSAPRIVLVLVLVLEKMETEDGGR